MSRESAEDAVTLSKVTGSAFGLEMLLIAVKRRAKIVQVPVNYHPRVGESAVTGHLGKTIVLGSTMIEMVLRMRVTRLAPAGARAGRIPA
jgi:hypothetical protein